MPRGMPIVICCSDEDRAALAEIAASLEADGNDVQFVEGIAADPKRLAPLIEALDRQGLYVLCRSKGLDRATVEEMREILLAEQVPFSRTLTVAAGRPSMVAERIRSSLGRVRKASEARAAAHTNAARRAEASAKAAPPTKKPAKPAKPTKPEPAESPTVNLGPPPEQPDEDDGPTLSGVEAQNTGALSTDRTGAGPVLPKPDPDPASLPSISARRGPPPPPAPTPPPPTQPSTTEDSVVAPLPSASSVELQRRPEPGDDSLARMASSLSDIDLSDLDYGDTSIGRAPEGPTGPGPQTDTVVTSIDALAQGNTVRARAPETEHIDPGGFTDPVASASIALAPPPLPLASPPPAPAHSSPAMSPPPPAPSARTAAAAGATAPGIPRIAWLVGGGVALGLLALAVVCAVQDPDPDDDPKKVASKDDTPKSKASETPAGDASDEPDEGGDEGTTPTAAADDMVMLEDDDAPPSVVLAAIQRRNVRALDILLVQAKSAGVLEFQDAHDYCRTLEIDALADWRLPDIGELHSIGSADMLVSRTAYWSSTPADTFGDRHLAFVPRRSRVLSSATKADVLCVRGDRAST